MWQKLMDKLNHLNPYPPGKHEGICDTRYCVVKENTQSPYFNTNKLGYKLYDIILFVPMSSYIEIEPYRNEIKQALEEITEIRKTGNETPVISDDSKKAYTTSIEYQVIKRL